MSRLLRRLASPLAALAALALVATVATVALGAAGSNKSTKSTAASAASADVSAINSTLSRNTAGGWTWWRLGGDPLKQGGVNNTGEVSALANAPSGNKAMRLSGLTPVQRAAVRKAQWVPCSLEHNAHLQSASFGSPVRAEQDVTYMGPTTKAFCAWITVSEESKQTTNTKKAGINWKPNGGKVQKFNKETITTIKAKQIQVMFVAKCGNFVVTGKTQTTTNKLVGGTNFEVVTPGKAKPAPAKVIIKKVPVKVPVNVPVVKTEPVAVSCSLVITPDANNRYKVAFQVTPNVVPTGRANLKSVTYNVGAKGADPLSTHPGFEYAHQDGTFLPVATATFSSAAGDIVTTCGGTVSFSTTTVNVPVPTPGPTVTVYNASGSTFAQSNKGLEQACPAPNEHIIKTGYGDSSLTSPVMTGSGSTQAAAQADLDAKLAAWRTANQPSVDSDAMAKANTALQAALQGCPVIVEHYSTSGSVTINSHQEVSSPCPCQEHIIKTGYGDSSLTSPVMTGSGSTQAAAQADLDAKLAAWRTANQPSVDSDAMAKANDNLELALEDCPQPPPPPVYECTAEMEDEYVVLGSDAHLIVSPNGPATGTTVNWGEGYASLGNEWNRYLQAGRYEATATVTYDNGSTSTCSAWVKVKAPYVPEPDPCKDKDDVETDVKGEGHDSHRGNGYGHDCGGHDHNGDDGDDSHGHNGGGGSDHGNDPGHDGGDDEDNHNDDHGSGSGSDQGHDNGGTGGGNSVPVRDCSITIEQDGNNVHLVIDAGGPTVSDPMITWEPGVSNNVPWYSYAMREAGDKPISVTAEYTDGAKPSVCTTGLYTPGTPSTSKVAPVVVNNAPSTPPSKDGTWGSGWGK